MAITNPMLPPLKGYVEVIDESGNHVYKATAEQLAQNEATDKLREMEAVLNELLGVQADE